MTYEDEQREEHQNELDQRDDERLDSAIAYTERENANLLKAVLFLEKRNTALVAALEAVDEWFEGDRKNEPATWLELGKIVKQALAQEGDE